MGWDARKVGILPLLTKDSATTLWVAPLSSKTKCLPGTLLTVALYLTKVCSLAYKLARSHCIAESRGSHFSDGVEDYGVSLVVGLDSTALT